MFWFLLAVVAGVLNGSFTLPMKYVQRWKWEHTWGVWSFWALLIFPLFIAFLTVPDLMCVFQSESEGLLSVFLIGCAWGIGAITFGMGVHYLGIALGFALIMGLTTAVGSLVPLALGQVEEVMTRAVLLIVVGVVIIVLGIAVCSLAGHFKEKSLGNSRNCEETKDNRSFLKGLIVCIIAGISGPCINFAFINGSPIMEKAADLGTSPLFAPNVVWAIALPGGFLVNFGYCHYLIFKKKNRALFRAESTKINWLLTLLMGVAWTGSIVLYGLATAKLGSLGPSIGWSAFLGTAIVMGNIWGLVTGEWKGAGKRPVLIMLVGVVLVIFGIYTIGGSKL